MSQLNNEINISESSFKILSIPQTIIKPHLELISSVKSKTDLDDLNSSMNNKPPTDIKSFMNKNSEIKSITQLNSKHNKEFIKSKTTEISKQLALKSNLVESQRSNISPVSKFSHELFDNNNIKPNESMLIPQENYLDQKDQNVENSFDLSFRKITHISLDFHLVHRNLVDLNLSYNELAEFPSQLLELINLRFLKLDFNKIVTLPNEILQLSQLEFFSISNNKIITIPDNILHLQNLKCFNIGKNFLKAINLELTCLENLEVLYIYGNLLETFPVTFRNLINLKEFAFDWLNYTVPPIDTIIKKSTHSHIFNKLLLLCKEMEALKIEEISFINFIQSLSFDPIDFNKSDSKLRNMLHIASLKDDISVIYNLTKEFPDFLNQVDKENQTPLTLALLENKPRSIQILLDLGADPRKGGGHLGSALHLAAFKLDVPLIEKFLRSGCSPNGLDFDKNTPLHLVFSIFSKNEEDSKRICELLMNSGCNPNLKNKDNWTALHLAVKRMQIKAIHWAVDYNKRLKMNNIEGKLIFNFNKRGGTHKFSPLHLATHQGTISIIEALFEGDSNMFLETNLYQIPKDLSYHSLLMVKISRKLETLWLKMKLNKKNSFKNTQMELNVGNMKSKIEKTLNKQNSSVFGAEELKNIKKMNKEEEKKNEKSYFVKEIGKDLKIKSDKLILPNFLCNIMEEPVMDPDSFDLSDGNVEEIEDLEEFNGTSLLKANNHLFSRNITQGFNNISELNSRHIHPKSHHHKDPLEQFFFQSPTIDQSLFFQNQDIMKSLHSLSLKHYLPELKKFVEVMLENSVAFDEKLKYLWFMKLLHYRIINYHRKFVSKYLPCCVYVLNEFYNPFERLKDTTMNYDQSEFIPNVLMKFYEKLLIENEENLGLEEKNDNKNNNNISNSHNNNNNNNSNNSNIMPPPLQNILKNNIEDNINFFDKNQLKNLKRYENCLILQELNRIFSEFSYKKSKSTLKSIIRTPWITKLNTYEAIQSLLYLLYYKPIEKKRDHSVPIQYKNTIFQNPATMKEYMDDSKAFIKTLEEETPIKRTNISSIKSRYKENMMMKNPFGGKKTMNLNKKNSGEKNFENVNEEEANDAMELHLEKYFPSKSFQTPFKEEFKQLKTVSVKKKLG